MRLPFISRRRHETAVDFLAAVHRLNLAGTVKLLVEEQAARLKAEAELAAEQAAALVPVEYVGPDNHGRRLARLRRAVAAERRQSAAYRRTIDRLTDQLLDATGYQGEPLLPAARTALGIDAKEVAK